MSAANPVKVPFDVFEDAAAILRRMLADADGSDVFAGDYMEKVIEIVAPALMALGAAEKDAEIERLHAAVDTCARLVDAGTAEWVKVVDSVRAENAAEVSAAMKTVADAIHATRHDGGSSRKPDSFFWGIAPGGIAAHNAKIATDVSEEIAVAIEAAYEDWRTLDPANPLSLNPLLHSAQWYVERVYADAARIARAATIGDDV